MFTNSSSSYPGVNLDVSNLPNLSVEDYPNEDIAVVGDDVDSPKTFVPLSTLTHSVLPLTPSDTIVPGLYPPSTLLCSEILKVTHPNPRANPSPSTRRTSWVLPSSPSFSPTPSPPSPPPTSTPTQLTGYFRSVIDLESVPFGYCGFTSGTLLDLETISESTDSIITRCRPSSGALTMLAVRLPPSQQYVRVELSFRSSDGCVSLTLDGVEVVMFDEGFCVDEEEHNLGVRMFVYAGGKGGVVEGGFYWDKGTWIEELEIEIDECIRERRGKEEGNRLMQEVRERIEQAERRGGAVGREEVAKLCEMGERLGAREVSLEEEVLTIVARIKRRSQGSAAGELLEKIRGIETEEVREELVKTGVMRSLLRCVKSDGSQAFRDDKAASNLFSVPPQLLECIVLCVAGVEHYDDIRGLGKEMEEATWEVMEEAGGRVGGEEKSNAGGISLAEAHSLAIERLCSVVKKWTDEKRRRKSRSTSTSTSTPASSPLSLPSSPPPPASRHLSALLSTSSLPPSPSKAPSPLSQSSSSSSNLPTEEILQRLTTQCVSLLCDCSPSEPQAASKALVVLHTLTCIQGTLPLLIQCSSLSFLVPYLNISSDPSLLVSALKCVIGVVGENTGNYRGFVEVQIKQLNLVALAVGLLEKLSLSTSPLVPSDNFSEANITLTRHLLVYLLYKLSLISPSSCSPHLPILLRNLVINVDDEGHAMETIAGIVRGRKAGCEELVKAGGVGIMVTLTLGNNSHNKSKALQCLSLISGSLGPDDDEASYGPLLDGGIVECFSDVLEETITQPLSDNPNPNESSSGVASLSSNLANSSDLKYALSGLGNLMHLTESAAEDSNELDALCVRLLDSSSVPGILRAAKGGTNEIRDDVFRALSYAANLCRRSKRMRNKLGYEKLLLEQFVEKLISSSSRERVEEREDDVEDYVVWALRGVKELACIEPLKIIIVEHLLPSFLALSSRSHSQSLITQLTTQILLLLGFTPSSTNDLSMFFANDLGLMRDWFYTERCLILQSMCREEIKKAVYKSWINGVRGADETYQTECATAPSTHIRSSTAGSNHSSSSSFSTNPPSSIAIERLDSPPISPKPKPTMTIRDDADVEMESLKRMWSGLEADDGMGPIREKVLREYCEMLPSSNDGFLMKKSSSSDMMALHPTLPPQTPTPASSIIENITNSLATSPAMGFFDKFKPNNEGGGILKSFIACHPPANQAPASSPRFMNALNSIRKDSITNTDVGGAEDHISRWILSHSAAMKSEFPREQISHTLLPLPRRVADMLQWYFSSLLLLEEVGIREGEWAPESRCDIRALAMPERQYFSFRREGKVVTRVVQKYLANVSTVAATGLQRFTSTSSNNSVGDSGQSTKGWTLCFRNSIFGGEFVETLLQTLYRNQSVENLVFVGKHTGEENSNLLAHLVSSLPKSVGSVVFDGILCGKALEALSMLLKRRFKEDKVNVQLNGLAITNSGYIKPDDFEALWEILGGGGMKSVADQDDQPRAPLKMLAKSLADSGLLESDEDDDDKEDVKLGGSLPPPLLPLRWLDLANNKMGDAQSAKILDIVLSSSTIETLNLNGNNIKSGVKVAGVLERLRDNGGDSIYVDQPESCLRNLYLNSNLLSRNVVEAVLNSVGSTGFDLERLGLSDNGVQEWGRKKKGAIRSLLARKTSLVSLDLSSNAFTSEMIGEITFGLYEDDKTLTVLKLQNNSPPVSQEQIDEINSLLAQAKAHTMKLWLYGGAKLPVADAVAIPPTPLRSVTTGGQVAASNPPSSPHDDEEKEREESLESLELDNSAIALNRSRRSTSEPIPVLSSTIARANKEIIKAEKLASKTEDDRKAELQTANLNSLTVLFSAPLVFRNARNKLQPIEMLAFDNEREIVCQCFREASRDIDLKFDTATTHRLRASVTLGCRALHYSGHGHENFLTFEDGKGGLHAVNLDELKTLCAAGATDETNVEFVFVSACYSKLAGEAFVGAGVNHVVCCQQDLLQDSAALAFTRAFYLALAVGRTVRDAFEIGKQAVNASPSVPNADTEMEKFLLLPEFGDHNVQIFKGAKKVEKWCQRGDGGGTDKRRVQDLRKSWGERRGGGDSGRMTNLPAPPEDFLGRETDMYEVLNAVLTRRLVSVVGVPGVGRGSLVTALAGYIQERRNTTGISTIFFIRPSTRLGRLGGNFITRLYKQVVKAGWISNQGERELDDEEEVMELVLNCFRTLTSTKRVLVVFNHIDDDEGDLVDFRIFLSQLFSETRYVKVLCTSKREIGLRGGGAGEFVYALRPLTFYNSVRLFARLCPQVHTGTDRKALVDLLVNDDQGNLAFDGVGIQERTSNIFKLIGDGYPNRIFDSAYSMSAEQFKALWLLGCGHNPSGNDGGISDDDSIGD